MVLMIFAGLPAVKIALGKPLVITNPESIIRAYRRFFNN